MSAARVWTPYKELQVVVDAAIQKKQPDAIHDLEIMLRKHKADFLSLLKTLVSLFQSFRYHHFKGRKKRGGCKGRKIR